MLVSILCFELRSRVIRLRGRMRGGLGTWDMGLAARLATRLRTLSPEAFPSSQVYGGQEEHRACRERLEMGTVTMAQVFVFCFHPLGCFCENNLMPGLT
jgi:hypothetical protein